MKTTELSLTRRGFVAGSSAGLVAGAAGLLRPSAAYAQEDASERKGRINQSVCKWCFGNQPLDSFAAYCASIGIKSIELVEPHEWPILKKHGLICAMTPSHDIAKGLNRTENHAECLAKIRASIEKTSEAGFPNVICFSGNRARMDDDEGMKNCEIAIKEIVGFAEQKNVTICMELLNSKCDHRDYMCDRTRWGGALVRRWAHRTSDCCMTFITCRFRKAMSSPPSANTETASVIITPPASRDATSLTRDRSCFIRRLCGRLRIRALTDMSVRSLCRGGAAIRSRRWPTRSSCVMYKIRTYSSDRRTAEMNLCRHMLSGGVVSPAERLRSIKYRRIIQNQLNP